MKWNIVSIVVRLSITSMSFLDVEYQNINGSLKCVLLQDKGYVRAEIDLPVKCFTFLVWHTMCLQNSSNYSGTQKRIRKLKLSLHTHIIAVVKPLV